MDTLKPCEPPTETHVREHDWHWVENVTTGETLPMKWSAGMWAWDMPHAWLTPIRAAQSGLRCVCPVPTPDEIAATNRRAPTREAIADIVTADATFAEKTDTILALLENRT